ncbi:MAG: hypothetical protein WD267_13445 [Balneolales bacterium]
MPNADDLCVEYVLNELDPSEVVLVERAMEKDMDLLIEIECLRRTLKKLESLPLRNPPANIHDAIIHHAVSHYHDNRRSLFPRWNNTTAMATATAVVFSVLISIVNFYPEDMELPKMIDQSSANESKAVNPWVDNNNILHINQSSQSSSNIENISAGNSDLQHSLQRLKLIDHSLPLSPDMRDIQLTRTSN